MKVAFPVEENKGLDSQVYGHFGSAPCFIILDEDSGEVTALTNRDAHHEHGRCQPLNALGGIKVDLVAVGGIGAGALEKLQREGIRVFRAVEGKVRENWELLRLGKLPEFSAALTCRGHEDGSGCVH
jgi:predicted Fe-Mo cluster-binding NifX family protein